MNLARFQNKKLIHRKQLHFYTLINYLERKSNLFISNSFKKNKILRKNLIKEVTDL